LIIFYTYLYIKYYKNINSANLSKYSLQKQLYSAKNSGNGF